VGKPRQWMPVCFLFIREGKRPDNTFACQSPLYMTVLCDVKIIVEIYKIMAMYLPVNSKGSHNEKHIHRYFTVFDKRFFATIVCSGHGKIDNNKDGFLMYDFMDGHYYSTQYISNIR
jgi:hypothetical protein